MFSLQKLAVIGKSAHYKMITKLEGKKNVKLVISDCTKIASKRPTFHQVSQYSSSSLNVQINLLQPCFACCMFH